MTNKAIKISGNMVQTFIFLLCIISMTDSQVPGPPGPSRDVARPASKTINGRTLTLNGKTLPVTSSTLKVRVANHLYGESLKEREEVWSLMDKLTDMMDKANNDLQGASKSKSRPIEEIDGKIDDIVLDKEDLEELIAAYKAEPKLMIIDDDNPSVVVSGPRGPQGPTGPTNTTGSKPGSPGSAIVSDIAVLPEPQRGVVSKIARKWKFPIKYRIKGPSPTLVKEAIRHWEKHTCVRFKEQNKGIIWGSNIVFRKWNRLGCWSRIGRKPISQSINVGKGCDTVGVVVHEIGHALGFWHEHQRRDRGKYVKIHKKNIKLLKRSNFWRIPKVWSRTYSPYDYSSIMHYNAYAFTKKKDRKTITTKKKDFDETLGQRNGLSFYDAKTANWHYCQSSCKNGLKWSKCKNNGYKNPNKCTECKCPDGLGGKYCDKPAPSRPSSSSCGTTSLKAKSSYQELTSPGYTSGRYATNNECSWLITAPSGKKIQLQFRDTFRLNCDEPCQDFVEVRYQNLYDAGPRYCCKKRPSTTFRSSKNQMLLNFRTYSGKRRHGFKVRYRYD